jgi:hypothetical protein
MNANLLVVFLHPVVDEVITTSRMTAKRHTRLDPSRTYQQAICKYLTGRVPRYVSAS